MAITQLTKNRIINIILAYKDLFPKEYEATKQINKQRAETQNTAWGESVTGDVLGREVLRMPTNLHETLFSQLSTEQWQEFQSDAGIIWLQRKFPEFVPNKKIE
jgi:hypothetical protein